MKTAFPFLLTIFSMRLKALKLLIFILRIVIELFIAFFYGKFYDLLLNNSKNRRKIDM